MRDANASVGPALGITDDLDCETTAAVVYGPNSYGESLLRLNRSMLTGNRADRVLSWARREIALGKRVSWLLADELAALA